MPSEIVLVNVSGDDQPGLMSMLTSSLAQFQVRILDVGQAVIHDQLNVGMLVQIMDSAQVSAVLRESRSLRPDGWNQRALFPDLGGGLRRMGGQPR